MCLGVERSDIKDTAILNRKACCTTSLCRKEVTSLLDAHEGQRKEPFCSHKAGTGSWGSEFLGNSSREKNVGQANPHHIESA